MHSLSSLYDLRPRIFKPVCALTVRALFSSLSNPSSPPLKQIILPEDRRDLKHWLIIKDWPRIFKFLYDRDETIGTYISDLGDLLGSEEEAKRRIYSVSTKHIYAFGGALLSEEETIPLTEIKARIYPDPYVYEGLKEFQGEPFINGKPVPYDPKYHEEWVRIHGEKDEDEDEGSHRPPGMDFKHWIVLMDVPNGCSIDELINLYVKTLAHVVDSEEEARSKIYWVSTKGYGFGALISRELARMLEDMGLPGVHNVSPDSYRDVEKKEYGAF